MMPTVLYKTYSELPIQEEEILRYLGAKNSDPEIHKLMNSALSELDSKLSFMVCYCRLPIKIKDNICNFGEFSLESKDLAINLKEAKSVFVFAATIGVEIDRLILKYGRISPFKALMFQAIGTERVEALCDRFCDELKSEYEVGLTPRFSAGYGDLSITAQKVIFKILDCEKRLGITLNNSLVISPSKSVTAFVGVTDCGNNLDINKCKMCSNFECAYRGEIWNSESF